MKLAFIFLLLILYIIYVILIKQYFRKNDNVISYNFFKKWIDYVSEGNDFMNYGLWNDDTQNLMEANKNLIQLVFDKSELTNKPNINILDVGCGYGEQDIEWCKLLDKTCKIKAMDISEKQIYHAMEKNNNINNITFDICDVKYIDLKYKNEVFDVIFSLESAFHYPEREMFFKNANNLLSDNGKFIITDIMLNNDNNNNIVTNMFTHFFSDFLCIPKLNLITADEWDKQLVSNFVVEENIDITEKTFKPYYTHFMTTYVKNKNWPQWFGTMLTSFFCTHQPFTYKIAVCKKIKCATV
jgi:cyclopropane fatty-acyl-phospholipid synthase-like methyltransferase